MKFHFLHALFLVIRSFFFLIEDGEVRRKQARQPEKVRTGRIRTEGIRTE